jgi:hypothetical protein
VSAHIITPAQWAKLEEDYVSSLNEHRRSLYERMPRDLQVRLYQGSIEWSLAVARWEGCKCSEWQLNNVGCDCERSRREPKGGR